MGSYRATVSWESDGEFTSGKYSRAHRLSFDGGAVLRGSSSPLSVPLPMSDPAAVDPEEMLVASASACHMLWFLSLARGAGLDIASYRDEAEGAMGKDERGKIAVTRIALRPAVRFVGRQPDADELGRLHRQAHEKCFIANSLRSEIVVESAAH
ncbi:MAG TPA: OsmC family protein [Allosphingosinicella sp.]|nr:OsmC family protein [Allosphingosinicella sp.]